MDSKKPLVSVIIPTMVRDSLYSLVQALLQQECSFAFEIIVIPHKPYVFEKLTHPQIKVFPQEDAMGVSYYRNCGINKAQGEILAFIDDDEMPQNESWLAILVNPIIQNKTEVSTSGCDIPLNQGYIADSISLLGYPGGAALGFKSVWQVQNDNTTKHLCSGNFAIKKVLMLNTGGFANSLKTGKEDVFFADMLNTKKVKILYVEDATVLHAPRKSIFGFIKWHFSRGKAAYEYKKISNIQLSKVKSMFHTSLLALKDGFKKGYLMGVILCLLIQYKSQLLGFVFMKIKERAAIYLAVFCFALTLIMGHQWSYGLEHVFTSSKENVSLAFAEQFADNFKLNIPLKFSFDDQAMQAALTPRDAAQLDGNVVPQSFPAALMLSGLLLAMSKWLLLLLTPLTFALIVYFFYQLISSLFNQRIAFSSSVLLTLLPGFLYLGTSLISDDLLSLLFLVVGAERFTAKKMPSSALLFGLSVLFRLPNAIWTLPFIVIALIKIKDKKWFLNWKYFTASIALFILPLLLIPLLNKLLYGAITNTGYGLQYPIINQIIGSSTSLFTTNLNDFIRQITNYVVLLYPVAFVFVLLGVQKLRKERNKVALLAVSTMSIIFVFLTWQYGGSIFWGYDEAALNSSFIRYTLPFFLVIPPLCSLAIESMSSSRKIWAYTLLIVSFVLTSLFFRGGMVEKWKQLKDGKSIQTAVLLNTETDTLVLTTNLDKLIYPKRQVMILPLLRENIAYGYTQTSPWQVPLDEEKIAASLYQLKHLNVNYLLLASPEIRLDLINKQLAINSLKLEKQFSIDNIVGLSVQKL